MNSGLQCLKAIPELKEPLKNFHKDPSNLVSSRGYFASALVSTLGGLMAEMDSSVQPVTPFSFISTLKTTFPQFGEVSNEGVPMQQDAEEALGQLLHAIGDTPGLQDGSKNLFHGQFLST